MPKGNGIAQSKANDRPLNRAQRRALEREQKAQAEQQAQAAKYLGSSQTTGVAKPETKAKEPEVSGQQSDRTNNQSGSSDEKRLSTEDSTENSTSSSEDKSNENIERKVEEQEAAAISQVQPEDSINAQVPQEPVQEKKVEKPEPEAKEPKYQVEPLPINFDAFLNGLAQQREFNKKAWIQQIENIFPGTLKNIAIELGKGETFQGQCKDKQLLEMLWPYFIEKGVMQRVSLQFLQANINQITPQILKNKFPQKNQWKLLTVIPGLQDLVKQESDLQQHYMNLFTNGIDEKTLTDEDAIRGILCFISKFHKNIEQTVLLREFNNILTNMQVELTKTVTKGQGMFEQRGQKQVKPFVQQVNDLISAFCKRQKMSADSNQYPQLAEVIAQHQQQRVYRPS